MTSRFFPFAVVTACCVAVWPAASLAAPPEEATSFTVTVKDNWGVLPGAVVRLTQPGTATSSRGVADPVGEAFFSSLAPGTYDLKVGLTGFADHEQTGIELGAGEHRAVEVTLELARFSTTVTVTTANRREQLLLDVAEPTTLIDEVQILDSGGRTAKDVLGEQSGAGVQVHSGGGQGHISINGISNSGVLVLIDGRRYLGRDGIGNFNTEDLDLSGIERVEIVKGASSAIYGTDALGGVVNFISKRAEDPGARNTFDLSGGSFGDLRLRDTFSYRGERGGFGLSGGFRTYDGFDLDEENPQTIGQPKSKWYELEANADVSFSDKATGRLFASYSLRDIDDYFFAGATQEAEDTYNSQRELLRYNVSPELDLFPTDDTHVNLSFTYGKYDRDENQVYMDREDVQVPWKEWNQELKATLSQTWRAFEQEHQLQLGYEHRNQKMDRENLVFPDTDQTTVERDINVVWLQQEFSLGSRLKLTGGFRYDDNSDFGSEWSPKAGAVFTAAEGHRLRASYGHGFRAPRFGELYIDLGPFFKGNADLLPVISDNWTAGYAYSGSRVQASLDYFDYTLENLVTFDLSGFPYTYKNIDGKSKSKGVNADLAVNLPGGFTPSIAYTYNTREDEDGETIGGFPPPHSVHLKLLWANPRLGVRANLRGNIIGEEDPADDTFTPAHNVWDFHLSKAIVTQGAYAFRLFVQVDNLLDESDVFRRDENGEPIPGELQAWIAPRTFLAGVTIDMDWAR